MALVYAALNILSLAIVVTILWRVQFFITLSQRSNVETLTLAIILILALYYVFTTFKGFVGALRLLWLNSPKLFSRGAESVAQAEQRKQRAMHAGKESKYTCLDKVVRVQGKPEEAIKWQVVDKYGKLGELELDGVKLTYYPLKDGMNDSIFEFMIDQLEAALQKQDLEATLEIVQWSTIDQDQASAYHSTVQAFQNLEKQLGKGTVWPTVEITEEDKDKIQTEIERLVPALRNESFLPDVEYEVEYNVPVLPEPLGFFKLTRRENRADPLVTMGCAGITMLVIMAVLTFFILLPPWVPSK
jgi:hypothetical protein